MQNGSINFIIGLNFICSFGLGMVMYDDEFETKLNTVIIIIMMMMMVIIIYW